MSESRLEGGRCFGVCGARGAGTDVVVSVIIATFNCVDVIEEAIVSVLEQDYSHKELIIVDGGSSDGTLDIIGRYNDSIDFWVSEPDEGVYDALNKGINLARGAWLYFLGADDRLFDKKVLGQIFSRRLKGELLYGNVLLKGNGVVGENDQIYDGKFSRLKLCDNNICHQAIFYQKTLFETLGKYDLSYRLLADWVFNMKVFGHPGFKTTYIDEVIAIYDAEGRSNNVQDEQFAHDKFFLIRRYLGWYLYLWLMAKSSFLSIKAKMGSSLVKLIK